MLSWAPLLGKTCSFAWPRTEALASIGLREGEYHTKKNEDQNAANSVEQRLGHRTISFSIACKSEPLNQANSYQRHRNQNGLADRRLSEIVDASHHRDASKHGQDKEYKVPNVPTSTNKRLSRPGLVFLELCVEIVRQLGRFD